MIDAASPPGSYRAALDPSASCAVCRQSVCAHADLEYAGLASVARAPEGWEDDDGWHRGRAPSLPGKNLPQP